MNYLQSQIKIHVEPERLNTGAERPAAAIKMNFEEIGV